LIPAVTTPPVHRFEAAGLGKAPFEVESFQICKYQACQGAPIQPGASCDFCGTGIMLVYVIRSADNRRFKVGCDCVEKTGDAGLINAVRRQRAAHTKELTVARRERARAAKRRTREQAARARRARTRRDACTFAREHGLIDAFRVAVRGSKRALARDLLQRLLAMGTLSPAQVRLVQTLGMRLRPAPAGRVTFAAVIDSVSARDSVHGTQYKMTVTADDGFRAWMTAPRTLWLELLRNTTSLADFRGLRVQVTATLTPSADDPGFAFGKRPTVRALEGAPQPAAGSLRPPAAG
jgi:hypothetical protein